MHSIHSVFLATAPAGLKVSRDRLISVAFLYLRVFCGLALPPRPSPCPPWSKGLRSHARPDAHKQKKGTPSVPHFPTAGFRNRRPAPSARTYSCILTSDLCFPLIHHVLHHHVHPMHTPGRRDGHMSNLHPHRDRILSTYERRRTRSPCRAHQIRT